MKRSKPARDPADCCDMQGEGHMCEGDGRLISARLASLSTHTTLLRNLVKLNIKENNVKRETSTNSVHNIR